MRIYVLLVSALLVGCTSSTTSLIVTPLIQQKNIDVHITINPTEQEESLVTVHIKQDEKPLAVNTDGTYDVAHLTLASHNLQDYTHVFGGLTEEEIGQYTFTHTFQKNEPYTMWIDIADTQTRDHHGDRVSYRGRAFYNQSATSDSNVPSPSKTYKENGIEASLIIPDSISANDVPFVPVITFKDENELPVTPFQDADHYYTIVRPLSSEYRLYHTNHPLQGKHSIALHPLSLKEPGIYHIWSELYLQRNGGGVQINPQFIFEVLPAENLTK